MRFSSVSFPRRLPIRPGRSSIVKVQALTVGIDLGTTNSSIAVVRNGEVEIVPLGKDDSTSIPSAVYFHENGKLDVGAAAYRAAEAHGPAGPLNLIFSAKRIIGRQFKDPQTQEQVARAPYKIVQGNGGQVQLEIPNRSERVLPTEVSAEVLRTLIKAAEERYGEKVDKAIIAVPVHFGPEQRAATREAAALAGIPSVGLLQEPVAAAVAYGAGRTTEADVILVFDLGGGTFDVSLLQDFEGIVEVLGTDGDGYLGGNDMDAAVAERIMASLGQGGAGPSNSHWPAALAAAETIKLKLSEGKGPWEEAAASVSVAGTSVQISGPEFDQCCSALRERMMKPLERIGLKLRLTWHSEPWRPGMEPITHARLDRFAPPPRKITKVVLVGAAVKTPWVMRMVREVSGLEPDFKVNPEHAVALGAAAYAGGLEGTVTSFELLDGAYNAKLQGRASGWEP